MWDGSKGLLVAASTFTLWEDLNQIKALVFFQLDIRNCHNTYVQSTLSWFSCHYFGHFLASSAGFSSYIRVQPRSFSCYLPQPPQTMSDYWLFPNFNGFHVYCITSPIIWALDPDIHIPTRYPYAYPTFPHRTLTSIANLILYVKN